jgi:hypothetical protein
LGGDPTRRAVQMLEVRRVTQLFLDEEEKRDPSRGDQ